jgi:RNA polymerase sigma-70 factor (ECF subfamily)
MQMNDFRKALAQLKLEQREALLLVGASGFSYEEAAEMCGVAVGTIKSRTNRARARLAELMGHEENDKLEMTDDATMSVISASRMSSF